MATRFYLQSGSTPVVSPAFHATLTTTTQMVRLTMNPVKQSTAFTDYNNSNTGGGGDYAGVVQFVSPPLNGAQTISGSLRYYVGRIRNVSGNGSRTVARAARVFTNDGTTVRGTLQNFFDSGTGTFGASYASVVDVNEGITTVNAQDGDRVVMDIGYRFTVGTAGTQGFEIGDNSGSDLGTTAGETNQYNPWIELTATLSFKAEAGGGSANPNGLTLRGSGT